MTQLTPSIGMAAAPARIREMDSLCAAALFESRVITDGSAPEGIPFRQALAIISGCSPVAFEIVDALVGAGVNVDCRKEDENNPGHFTKSLLHFAVECGSPQFVAYLLDFGAALDARMVEAAAARSTIQTVVLSWLTRRQVEACLTNPNPVASP